MGKIQGWKKQSAKEVQGGRGFAVTTYFLSPEEMEAHLASPVQVKNTTPPDTMARIVPSPAPEMEDAKRIPRTYMQDREYIDARMAPRDEVSRSGLEYLEASRRRREERGYKVVR